MNSPTAVSEKPNSKQSRNKTYSIMIINIIGHGFQWFRGNELNPEPFQIGVNTVIRLYVNAGVLYGAENTPPIIADERDGNMGNIIEHFEHGDNCPELLLIKDVRYWNDIKAGGKFNYELGFQLPNVDGHIVRIREIALPNEPREFVLIPEQDNQIFSLSWLAANIRAIMEERANQVHQNPPSEAEEIVLRWLVCRQGLQADNPEDIPERLNDLLDEPGRFKDLIR